LTVTLADGSTRTFTVPGIPAAGLASIYELRLASDGSSVFDLYYAPYMLDEHGNPVLNKLTYATELPAGTTPTTGYGAWTGNPNAGTYTNRVEYFFTEQNTGKLFDDIARAGYDFLGWSTDDDAAFSKGSYNRSTATLISKLPGWDTTEGAYVTAWLAGTDLTNAKARLFTKIDANGYGFIMPGTDVVIYAVWFARDDTEYTVNHYRVDGNGNVKDVITETITGITDEPVTAIDRIGDQDIKDAYDAASKAYNWDDEFKGYEIVLDGTTITFKDATGATVTKQNIRTGAIFGDGSLVLELYYKALPFTLTFDGGKDKGAWNVIDSSIDPNDHSKKYVTPVYAEQSFDIGANYSGAHITRPGYTLIGWTTQKEWTLTAADGSTRTLEVATAMGLDSRAIMQAIMLANAGYAPNDPNRIFYQVGDTFVMGNGDTTLYAVWSARTYDLYLNPGTTTSIDNNVWQNHVSLVTDEEYKLPGSSVLKRDGYELVGWYYKQSVTVSGQANPVYVGTSEGRLSQLAAAVAQLDTGWSYTEGAHFTLNDPNTMYSMPAPEPMGFLWLYAVWRASSDTEFTLHYYKVDGNGNLQIWQELKGKGIAGESYKIANPYDATEVANAQYYKMDGSAFSFSSVDWRGYKYMGLADGFTLFNGNQNGYNSDSTLTWNGITTFSIYGLQAMANWTAGVKGNIIATVAGDGSTVISVVMDTLPLNLILDPGIYGEWQPNGTIPSPYDSYADAANGNGVRADQNLPLPDGTEVKRPGYTLVGWYYYDTAVNLKGNASIAAANAAEADGSKVDGLWVFTAVGDLFTMPNHDVTLYAVWRANEDTEYEVIIYKIDGDGNRVVHNTITHKGVTDEEAWADATDTPKVSYRNDDRPHQHPIDKRRPYILGYEYVEPGTTVSYTDGSGNIVNVTTKARDYIMGHLDDGTHLVLELYFDAEEWDLTIDLGDPSETGAGHWTPDATETRPNAFPAAPGQNSHTHKYKSDQTIILPIDVRYGGVVTAGPDAQGRPYSLIGYAFDDGGTVNVLLPGDTTPTTMSTIDAIMMARSLNGLLNFAYRDALMASIDPNTGKGIFIKADDTGSIWTMGYENMTLYAIWGLSVQSLTFDPNGYADVNDPTVTDSKHHVHVKPDGTIDDTTTTATPGGKWNPGPNPPAGFEDGTMHNISEVVPLPDFDSVKRPGYTFLGWSTKLGATAPDADLTYVDVDGDGIPDAPTNWVMPADPTILYAVWQANDIELVYDANYPGITPPDPTLGKIGCIVNVTLQEPTRDGYRLKGWAVKANATEIDYKPGDEYEMLDLIVDPITGDIINPNVLYAVWELAGVELQYWGCTEDHPNPGDEQLLKTVYVQLGDDFDWTYDPNKDSDPSNDYISHKTVGWMDEWGIELFNQDWVDMMGGIQPTIQYIADLIGWDGVSPIIVYSAIELRVIEVIYDSGGFDVEHNFEPVRYITWDATPFYPGLYWGAHTLDVQTDEWGDPLDETLTCGDILMNYIFDPLADTMYISIYWIETIYSVTFIFPNGYTQDVTQFYNVPLALLTTGLGFNYPGYTFVGFFTEPDGNGVQITDTTRYADLVANDTVTSTSLYAYFVPDGAGGNGSGTSAETMSVVSEAVSLNAVATEPNTTLKPAKAAQASTSVAPAPKAASVATAAQSMGVASSADQAPLFGAGAGTDLDSVEAAEYAYTVNYYKNAVDAANLLGEAVLGKALLGTKIPYELGKFLPVGYTVEDALIEGALTVGENEEENVLNVIYAPELFSFFVNFYKDCVEKGNLVTSIEYEEQPFGSVVDLLAEDMNKYCPKGYTALTEDTSFTVGATPAENVLNLVFKPLVSVLPNDPVEPVTPVEPSTPAQPSTPSTSVQKPIQPSSSASSAAVKTAPAAPRAWVNPVIAVPEPSYSAEPEQVANSEIIPEDSRPLAANPFAKRVQSSSTGVIGGFFLLLAAAATAASLALMRMRKQSIQAAQGLKGSALTLEQARTQRLTRYAILAAAPALLFYALWVLFLI
ncbi:MAG: InlB B-repeat-containing protein, partial [Eggerthellaceae bacterium]